MHRTFRPRTLALVLLAVCALGVTGQGPRREREIIDPVGEPRNFDRGDTMRFAVWYDQRGWHVAATADKNKRHHFRGQIEVIGGTVEGLTGESLDPKGGRLGDKWKVGGQGQVLNFDFNTQGGIDGIGFRTSRGAREVRFRLLIDGKERRDRVYIGRSGLHPSDIPFTMAADPFRRGR